MDTNFISELIETLTCAKDAIEEKEALSAELAEVKSIASKLMDELDHLMLENNKLKRERYLLQLFIEENVEEEKKKFIFK